MACIVVLANRLELMDFSVHLREMLKEKINQWQRMGKKDVQDRRHQEPFVIYLCAAWYIATSYNWVKNSEALEKFYQLYWDTEGIAHQGWVDENSGLSEFAVTRYRIVYTSQEVHAARGDASKKKKKKKKKRKGTGREGERHGAVAEGVPFKVRSSDTLKTVRLKVQDIEEAS